MGRDAGKEHLIAPDGEDSAKDSPGHGGGEAAVAFGGVRDVLPEEATDVLARQRTEKAPGVIDQ